MNNIFFTDESVKRQITDSISENSTDSDLESRYHLGSKIIPNILCKILIFTPLSQDTRFELLFIYLEDSQIKVISFDINKT